MNELEEIMIEVLGAVTSILPLSLPFLSVPLSNPTDTRQSSFRENKKSFNLGSKSEIQTIYHKRIPYAHA